MEDDLYFRYMTQGSYDPVEWGHEKPKKIEVEKYNKKEISKLKAEIKKLES